MRPIAAATLLGILTLGTVGCQTTANRTTPDELWAAYYQAEETGNDPLANQYLDQLRDTIQATQGPNAVELTQVNLARAALLQRQNRLSQAEELYQQTLHDLDRIKNTHPSAPDTTVLLAQTRVLALTELGQIHVAREEWEPAVQCLEQAVNLGRQHAASDPMLPVLPLHDLAILRFGLGDYSRAETAIREALDRHAQAHGRSDISRVELLATYVVLLQKTGRSAEAEALTREADELLAPQ